MLLVSEFVTSPNYEWLMNAQQVKAILALKQKKTDLQTCRPFMSAGVFHITTLSEDFSMKILNKVRHSVMAFALVSALAAPMVAQAGGVCICDSSGCVCIIVIN